MWKTFNRAVDLIMKITAIVVGWLDRDLEDLLQQLRKR